MSGSFHQFLDRARELHATAIVIDSHVDTTQRLMDAYWSFKERHDTGHIDLPRLREGGVGGLFMAVWMPQKNESPHYAATVRAQIERIKRLCSELPGDLCLARSSEDMRAAKRAGKIAILIGIEGGYLIEDSIELLHEYRDAGAMYMTLTHALHTNWADSAGVHESLAAKHNGLTEFGRDVIREMNRIGMMVDVSHVSDATFWDVVKTSAAPIVATHSSCRAVSPHRRNLTDDMMRAIAASGGVVQINFASLFIDPDHPPVDIAALKRRLASGGNLTEKVSEHQTPLSRLVDHFMHAVKVVGHQHVGVGSDFDGIPAVPADMDDCSMLPNLTASMLERGLTEAELKCILGENILRVMDECHLRSVVKVESRPMPEPSSCVRA